ncbi:MAG: hypothetical protein ASARMPREDX12_002256 [Alectoria sarmentosa]|nr:MAG: hypothetical protein ASARMPREDX12_002256 [Alectoria sarmentosa]
MAPIPEPIQKHVPAWKKLGLKLKFAKEEPGDAQPSQNGTTNRKKRKIAAGEEDVVEYALIQGSAKKAKKSKPRAEGVGEAVNGNGSSHGPRNVAKTRKKIKKSMHEANESAEGVDDDDSVKEPANFEQPPKEIKKSKAKAGDSTLSANGKSGSTHEQGSSPPHALKTTPASKGKSVSFTPDTKTKDGDSVKGLYKTWIAKQIAIDPSFDPSTISPALRSVAPSIVASPESPSPASVPLPSTSTSESSSKKATKSTKKAKTRLPKTSSGPGPSRFDPVLTYLNTHHTSPQTWKFSKPHQNQILKHLFSITHIPPSYDPALLSYIRGLEGTSARSRIRKEALSIVEEDEKWLASESSETEKMENETVAQCNARRRRDYEAAVARIKQILREKEGEREERDWELLGEKEEWEERVRKRRRAEIVLWNVGEEEQAAEGNSVPLTQRNAFGGDPGRRMDSGIAQLAQAARDPGPAPRLGRGVGMGMGGVEVIDAGGIARGSRGKKVVFGDDGAAQAVGMNNVNGFGGAHGLGQPNGANGAHGVKMPDAGMKPKRKRKHKRRTGVPDDDESSSESSSSSSSGNGEKEDEQQRQQQQPQKVNAKRGANEPSGDETSSSGSGSGTSSSGDSDSE